MSTARMPFVPGLYRNAMLFVALAGVAPEFAQGSPMMTPGTVGFMTQGTVGEGWTGPVQFVGRGPSELLAPGLLDLGEFHLERIPARTTLGVVELPFEIQVWVWKPGVGPSGIDAPVIQIQGRIDGTMKGTTESSLVPQITSISAGVGSLPLPFDLENFSVQLPEVIRPYAEGPTGVYGYLNVPEPSTAATLLAGAALLAAGRWRRHRRSRVAASAS